MESGDLTGNPFLNDGRPDSSTIFRDLDSGHCDTKPHLVWHITVLYRERPKHYTVFIDFGKT